MCESVCMHWSSLIEILRCQFVCASVFGLFGFWSFNANEYLVICRLFYNYYNGCRSFSYKPKIWATINAIIFMYKKLHHLSAFACAIWCDHFLCSTIVRVIRRFHPEQLLSIHLSPHWRTLFVINTLQRAKLLCGSSTLWSRNVIWWIRPQNIGKKGNSSRFSLFFFAIISFTVCWMC